MNVRVAPRDAGLDSLKGLLVILMVFCHVLQFFVDLQAFPRAAVWIDFINVLVFPCFLFIFGRTAQLAFLSKPFQKAWPRIVCQAVKLYGAFCFSGIGYRVLAENRPLRQRTVNRILTLQDIPGWSEFLIAFAILSLLILIGFKFWQWLITHRLAFGIVCVLPIIASAVIPYEQISNVHFALFIGGTQYAYFSALLYLPYMMLGLIAQSHSIRKHFGAWVLGALPLFLPAFIITLTRGLPSRFPPSPFWLMLPALGIVLVSLATDGWARLRSWLANRLSLPSALRAILILPDRAVRYIGRHSLYCLLVSNLILFTLHGKNIAPELMLKAGIPCDYLSPLFLGLPLGQSFCFVAWG